MENKQLTDQYFLDRGYVSYEKTPIQPATVLCNFQKVFQDDKGKKYYIDVHKVSNEWMSDTDKKQEWYTPYAYEYSCQLYEKGTYAAMNLEFFSEWSLDHVEAFVERMFQNGELEYYEKYDE